MSAHSATTNAALQQLQRQFLAQIVTPDMANTMSFPFGVSKVLPEQSWAIYRRNYLEGHIAALRSTYTNTLALVGDNYFRQLARRYVMQTSSHHGDLNHYGAGFADLIEQFLPSLPQGETLAYLPDMARLDWAWFEMLRAPDTGSDTGAHWLAQLQNTSEEAWSGLRAKPACKILRSAFPLYQIWQLNENPAADEPVQLDMNQPETLLIARPNQVAVVRLTAAEACFTTTWLTETPAGASLEAALEAALQVDQHFDFGAILMLLARLNAIHSLE